MISHHPLLEEAHTFVDPAHQALIRDAEALLDEALAQSAKLQYDSRYKQLDKWCAKHDCVSFPLAVETLQLFLTEKRRQWSAWTASGYLTAISQRHLCAGLPDPTQARQIVKTVRAIRRETARAQRQEPTRPDMPPDVLIRLIDSFGAKRIDVRDKSWILLAASGTLWADDICNLDFAQIVPVDKEVRDGLWIVHGDGREPTFIERAQDPRHCPVYHLLQWLREAKITQGIVYPTMHSLRRGEPRKLNQVQLNRILHQRCRSAGIPPIYTTTSLRVELLVQGGATGHRFYDLCQQSGLKKNAVERHMAVGRRRRRESSEPTPVRTAPTTNRRTKEALLEIAERLDLHRPELMRIFDIGLRELGCWMEKTVPSNRRFEVIQLFELSRELVRRFSKGAPQALRRKTTPLKERSLLDALIDDGIENVTRLVSTNPHVFDAIAASNHQSGANDGSL